MKDVEIRAVPTDRESMSTEDMNRPAPQAEPLRRRGDRRVQDQVVADERRTGDRRDSPGVSALIRTLFRRANGKKS
jgi:hypothetical protein